MPIFQKSVINKYLKNLDNDKVNLVFKQFQRFYGDKLRLFDIVHLKEENYQEGFLREVFVQSLGYTIRPDLNYNLTTEYKNQTDSKKADGAIIRNNSGIGVIELKSAKTHNLDNIKNQAFNYKHNQPDCRYIITSNFHYLRFYIDNSIDFEEFDLFEFNEQRFKLFYLILSQESVFNDIPLKMKEETKFHEENISDKFYKDYKAFKDQIFENLVNNNIQYDKLTLFKKSQKLLDRFLFVLFAEDCGLCPPNSIQIIIDQWKNLNENDSKCSLYSRFQRLFQYLDKGFKGKTFEFPGYNGGLFKPDELLDNEKTIVEDYILLKHTPKLSSYDFNTEIDVNILGHIFEHSLNEIEEISAELKGEMIEKSKSKRKKDGIFYTPKYITNYIVENTVGKLCKDKRNDLQISDIEINDTFNKNGKITKQGKELYTKFQEYKNWLLTLKILDPACGSGAFLNAALDFLINEHNQIDDLISDLTGDKMRLFDTDKNILENNIFGVDINEESVEIAKLSLWLRTAKKDRKLSDLNNNIKCGNSLIDNPEIAGDKAFNWHKEFPQIFGIDHKEIQQFVNKKEEKTDYLKFIKEKTLEAQQKAEKAKELSSEAVELTKKIYEYAEKLETVNEPETKYISKNVGFDVIIGNPPYFNIQTYGVSSTVCNFLKSDYSEIYQDKSDILFYFIKKALDLSKNYVSFIISNAFLFSDKAQRLRNWLLENADIIEIINFERYLVFQDASITSLIITLRKRKYSGNTNVINFKDKVLNPDSIANQIKIKTNSYSVSFEKDKPWALVKTELVDIYKKIDNNHPKLEDLMLVGKGMETAADNVFSFNEIPIEIPEKFFKKRVTGLNIDRYWINPQTEYLLYFEDIEKFEELNYSIQKHLNANKSILENRADKKRRPTAKWWNYTFAMHKEYYHLPKLLCSRRASSNTFVYDSQFNYLPFSNMTVIFETNAEIQVKYVLCLLNSKLLNFRYKGIAKQTGGGIFEYFPNTVGKLRIPAIDKSNQIKFIELADKIIELKKQFNQQINKVLERIAENLRCKISEKMSLFYLSDFKVFLEELAKQKIKISLIDQDEWKDYLNSNSKVLKNLNNQITEIDNKINKKVYELYNLTTEEISLVEGTD
jgi:hypothetical protein